MVRFQIDFDSTELPEFLIDMRMVRLVENFLNKKLAPIYEKLEKMDWTYVFAFGLLNTQESDAFKHSDYPLVPSSPRTLSQDRLKLISIAVPGNDIVVAEQPTLALCRVMAEAIGIYCELQNRSVLNWSTLVVDFPWEEVGNLGYPPGEDDVFHSPYGEPLELPDW